MEYQRWDGGKKKKEEFKEKQPENQIVRSSKRRIEAGSQQRRRVREEKKRVRYACAKMLQRNLASGRGESNANFVVYRKKNAKNKWERNEIV